MKISILLMFLAAPVLAVDSISLRSSDGLAQIGDGFPKGAIIMMSTSCPTGFTEVSSMSGRFPLGTVAANGDVGGTGGADNITPAGTVSQPTFTGVALSTHSHELPMQLADSTHVRLLGGATFGTGASRAAVSISTISISATSAAVALSSGVTAGTPAGTVSQPTFTGTQFDNRSAFKKIIFCSKD